jgi:hypothetical protein
VHKIGYVLVFPLILLWMPMLSADAHKQIVGATEVIEIQPMKLQFKARIDTGAKTSSIHAEDIEIDLNGDAQGKPIAFMLINKQGESQMIHSHVARLIKVKTSEGSETRYAVPLVIDWKNTSKTVLVTLNDRKHMRYGLLLGRNWLQGDFMVDTDINSDD